LVLTDLIYTLLFHISLLTLVYTNTLLLIPRMLKGGHYAGYVLGAGVAILIAGLLNQFTFNVLADLIFPGYYFISYYRSPDILQFMVAYWAISTALKMAKSWFHVNEQQQQITALEREKTQAELKALKAQLDPHFLFNSLNNIYSLALYEHPNTPQALLQLSQCLRYVLYDCKANRIALEKELDFLRNYLAICTLRDDLSEHITFTVRGAPQNREVAPLLFLPLVENAFKHWRKDNNGLRFITLELDIRTKDIILQIENTRTKIEAATNGGLGLINLKKRLKLLYPEQHRLNIHTSQYRHRAELIIWDNTT
jgi:LytS/YehU family sensor histidine kinase